MNRPRFQFDLKSLFVVTLLTALWCLPAAVYRDLGASIGFALFTLIVGLPSWIGYKLYKGRGVVAGATVSILILTWIFKFEPTMRAYPLVATTFVVLVTFAHLLSAEPPTYTDHQDLSYYLDNAGQRRPIETKEDWAQRKAHILAGLEATMGPLPWPKQKTPLAVKIIETTMVGPIARHKLTFHTDSAEQVVPAWLLLPPHKKDQRLPAVLCLHQTTKIGKDEPAGLGPNPNLDYALELAERGYVTLSPDYPSFGEYQYDFDPAGGYESGSMKAVWDNIRAVDLLASRPEVDAERIGCIGHSLGGHNTMFTAAFEPRIKALVSNCGFCTMLKDDLPSWTGKVYMPLIASRFGNDTAKLPWDFGEVVAAFAPRAFLASAAKGDNDFDWTGVQDAVAVAAPIYKLQEAEGNLDANYFDGPHAFPPAARQRAYEFLDKHLRGGGPRP